MFRTLFRTGVPNRCSQHQSRTPVANTVRNTVRNTSSLWCVGEGCSQQVFRTPVGSQSESGLNWPKMMENWQKLATTRGKIDQKMIRSDHETRIPLRNSAARRLQQILKDLSGIIGPTIERHKHYWLVQHISFLNSNLEKIATIQVRGPLFQNKGLVQSRPAWFFLVQRKALTILPSSPRSEKRPGLKVQRVTLLGSSNAPSGNVEDRTATLGARRTTHGKN